MSTGPWTTLCTFRDGSQYRSRTIPGGIEDRIFNADGTLQPLPGGRKTLADSDGQTIPLQPSIPAPMLRHSTPEATCPR